MGLLYTVAWRFEPWPFVRADCYNFNWFPSYSFSAFQSVQTIYQMIVQIFSSQKFSFSSSSHLHVINWPVPYWSCEYWSDAIGSIVLLIVLFAAINLVKYIDSIAKMFWWVDCSSQKAVSLTHYCTWENKSIACARWQSNLLVYTVCVLVHDILFQIPLSRKDIYSRFWLVKTIVWQNTRQKQANQKRLYISMRLSGTWNKILCTNTQTVKTTVWYKQTGCSAGYKSRT